MKSDKLQVIQYRKFYENDHKSATYMHLLLYRIDDNIIRYEFSHKRIILQLQYKYEMSDILCRSKSTIKVWGFMVFTTFMYMIL